MNKKYGKQKESIRYQGSFLELAGLLADLPLTPIEIELSENTLPALSYSKGRSTFYIALYNNCVYMTCSDAMATKQLKKAVMKRLGV